MNPQPNSTPNKVRFGPFEFHPANGELRKFGSRVRLQGQPLEILTVLLGRAGEMVGREELQQRLWKGNAFVDSENGLNTAVNKLRQALGESADEPRYVETVPGRGYRFIGILERPAESRALPRGAFPGTCGKGLEDGGGSRSFSCGRNHGRVPGGRIPLQSTGSGPTPASIYREPAGRTRGASAQQPAELRVVTGWDPFGILRHERGRWLRSVRARVELARIAARSQFDGRLQHLLGPR